MVLYPIGRWAVNPREIHTVVNRIRKVDAQVPMSILHPSRRHQIDLESLGEDLDEAAEILTYQDDFLGTDEENRVLPKPPPLITPRPVELEMERETISPGAPSGELNIPSNPPPGADYETLRESQGPENPPEQEERKFQIRSESENFHRIREPAPPVRGTETPSTGEIPGQSPEPDRDLSHPARRSVRPAALEAKKSIRQMVIDPFHRKRKK